MIRGVARKFLAVVAILLLLAGGVTNASTQAQETPDVSPTETPPIRMEVVALKNQQESTWIFDDLGDRSLVVVINDQVYNFPGLLPRTILLESLPAMRAGANFDLVDSDSEIILRLNNVHNRQVRIFAGREAILKVDVGSPTPSPTATWTPTPTETPTATPTEKPRRKPTKEPVPNLGVSPDE